MGGFTPFVSSLHQNVFWAILGILIICFSYILWRRREFYKCSLKLNGPISYPLIGNGLYVFGNGIDPLQVFTSLCQKYRDPFAFWFGPIFSVVIHSPDFLESILNHPKAMKKSFFYKYFEEVVGSGLLIAPVNRWKRTRKMMNPYFNQKMLNSFVGSFSTKMDRSLEELRASKAENFDVFHFMHSVTAKTIYENIFGVDINQHKEIGSFGAITSEVLLIASRRMMNVWLYPDLIFRNTSAGLEWADHLKTAKKLAKTIIRNKTRSFGEKEKMVLGTPPEGARGTILDFLIEEYRRGNHYNEKDLMDEILTLLAAGTDTISITLSFTLVMLGMHREIQARVYEEVAEILGSNDGVTHKDLEHLSYTEMVIKETMRLFPAGPMLARELEEDIKLGSNTIPAGTNVVLCVFYLHRNPDIWEDPLKFIPERFLAEECAKRHKYAYLPFSGGPRNCIGWKYAVMNMKTILAKIVKNFEVTTGYERMDEIKCAFESVLFIKDGFRLFLRAREGYNCK